MNQHTSFEATLTLMKSMAAEENKRMRKTYPAVTEQISSEVASEPILRLLADDISRTNREICELLDVRQQTMSNRLGRLLKAGAIKYVLRSVDHSNQKIRFYMLAKEKT